MAREILFKAKRIDNGEWVEGSLIDSGNHEQVFIYRHYDGASIMPVRNLVYHRMVAVDSDTICQYTGLTDKNGNKIWENDILSVLLIGETDEQKENCIVRYGRKAENFRIELGFNLEWTKTDYLRCDIGFWTENREVEVIGNIFDNPELIGGE